jgi:16S rRNA (adenine1518-N6/adenine1519-N6)-dimethyltransferase
MLFLVNEKFEHKKSLGQNFLTSDFVPKKMCDAADVQAGDIVLEIGPGSGVLTKEILARGAKVIAIEADLRAIDILQEEFSPEISSGQLVIHHQDARQLSAEALGLKTGAFKVVANIPYYISGLLFRKVLDTDVRPNTLVFLIQKEVAERIAREEKESLLSLSIKIFGTPTYICTVKRGHFNPPPKVDSAVVAVKNIRNDKVSAEDTLFFTLIHLGFAQKRKQLLGNLAATYNRADLISVFNTLNLPTNIRAEDVNLPNWLLLTRELASLTT